jgi:PEP-CTERM motif-containing protein
MASLYKFKLATAGLVAVVALWAPRAASADPIALTVSGNPSLQQTMNRPCVIGDPSCNNPNSFDYTLIGPQTTDATLSSPTYTVQQIRDLVGDTFSINLDLNQAVGQNGGAYDLIRFSMSVNGVVAFSTSSPTTLMPLAVGNGYSDASITGFNLTGLAPTDKIVFTTSFTGATAGREQYFLGGTASPSATPEPASMILLGTGLAGAYVARRRAQRSK